MPAYNEVSLERLGECHLHLQLIFKEVIIHRDCSILCGHRGRYEQEQAWKEKNSKINWPNSPHNRHPSMAIDVAPYPIDWRATRRFYLFAGYVMRVADELDIPLVWGGDWDGDRRVKDNKFNDLVHYELVP